MGSIKLNVDAGVSIDHNLESAAAICRDRDGTYMGSSILTIHGLTDPTVLEAIACRDALNLANDLGLRHLYIASDCKEVVNHIHEASGGLEGTIVREIKQQEKSFTSCSFTS